MVSAGAVDSSGLAISSDILAGRNNGYFANSGVIKLNLILVLSLISSYATGYDGSMMNGLQSLDTWKNYFKQPDASALALLNAIQNVGQLAAVPFSAFFCDYFGRRPVLVGSAFLLLLGVALQGGAQNTGMFIAARGILGLGLGFNITAAPLLILESAHPAHRAPMVSLYNGLWNSGAFVAAWCTFGTFRIGSDWAWRIPSLLQALSSVLQICLCWTIAESPRWLIHKDKNEQAEKFITKYHANGDPNDPIIGFEMSEIRESIRLEAEAMANSSYLSFFKTKGNRHRFLIILCVSFFSQWSGNGLISYYLTLILDSIGYKAEGTQTLINALLTLWNLVWGIAFSFIVNRFGRRTLFLVSTGGILCCYIIWTALEATYEKSTGLTGTGDNGAAKGVLAMIFLYNFMFSIGWTPLQVTYVVEILPFNLRARGLVLYNFFVACALIFNQYANPIGVTNAKWKFYITYDVWVAFELLVVYLLFIETGNKSLEETAAILDGEEVQAAFVEGTLDKVDKEALDMKRGATTVTQASA